MRKNVNSQNRSYFLFSFEDLRMAIKVKQELSRRKDLIGDKRAEVTILLDEAVITKNRDLSHTQKMFQNDTPDRRRAPQPYFDQGMKPPMMHHYPPPPPMYPGRGYPPHPYMPNPYYPPPPYAFYDQPYPYYKPEEPERQNHSAPSQDKEDSNIHDLLKDVLAGDKDPKSEKKPAKKEEEGREEDILSKLLGNESRSVPEDKEKKEQRREDREPSWMGFLTWNGQKRVGVDGHSSKVELEDYSINIKSTIEAKDMVLRERNFMVLEASNSIGRQTFREYVRGLEGRVGVALTSQYLMYVMAKSREAGELAEIGEEELLVVVEKASTLALVKDRLTRSEDLV